jgi:hypothetical protein
MGKLVLRLPDGGTREIPLERERITIGRRPDNDVCLPYPAVSGEHAAVVTILDDSFLEDLNSTNGTLVNGKSITKHFLRDHDEIDVGRQVLVYYSGDAVEATGASAAPDASEHASVAETRRGGRDTSRGEEGTLPLQPMVAPGGPGGSVDTATWYAAPHVRAGAANVADALAAERARAGAPTLEALDGPSAGRQFVVDRD